MALDDCMVTGVHLCVHDKIALSVWRDKTRSDCASAQSYKHEISKGVSACARACGAHTDCGLESLWHAKSWTAHLLPLASLSFPCPAPRLPRAAACWTCGQICHACLVSKTLRLLQQGGANVLGPPATRLWRIFEPRRSICLALEALLVLLVCNATLLSMLGLLLP